MKHFFIITNASRDLGLAATHEVEDFLRSNGKQFETHIAMNPSENRYTDAKTIPEEAECVIVIGGDGTFLQAVHDTLERNLPILGINLGKIGYLADVEQAQLRPALDSLLKGHYKIEERMMLDGRITGEEEEEDNGEKYRALNDIVIHWGKEMRVVNYRVSVNGKFLYDFRADGMIISTPTGSTAYSMSAGGPIVEPGSDIMILTPLCPHTINTRSVVLSADDRVTVSANPGTVYVSFDGRINLPMGETQEVRICKSSNVTKIVRLRDDSFLTVLHDKFILKS